MRRLIARLICSSAICLISASSAVNADTLAALVVPSLMDVQMDSWYRAAQGNVPIVSRVTDIHRDQPINLLIFFGGATSDKSGKLKVSYDLRVYGPEGNLTTDTGSGLLAYEGPAPEADIFLLAVQRPQLWFTDKYPLGTYIIEVVVRDRISGQSVHKEVPIELVAFSLDDSFDSEQEAGDWLMTYYKDPTPHKVISALRVLVKPDPNWWSENLNILSFFRQIFRDNPFLFKNLVEEFESFSEIDQKKLLLISAISEDTLLKKVAANYPQSNLEGFWAEARDIKFPDLSGEITTGMQLDMLWSEFLTTGRYDPIKKIVSALNLAKYDETLKKIQSGELQATEKYRAEAHLAATYRAARWSLASNCKELRLVYDYCTYIYQHEELTDDERVNLGAILISTQDYMKQKHQKQHEANSDSTRK